MPRGNAGQSKVHYQGKEEDFVVLIDDPESVQRWKNDRSIPLAQVVSGFKIFITHKYVNHRQKTSPLSVQFRNGGIKSSLPYANSISIHRVMSCFG